MKCKSRHTPVPTALLGLIAALTSSCRAESPPVAHLPPPPPVAVSVELRPAPVPIASTPTLPPGKQASVMAQLVWSNVKSSPSCFFFSGPNELGRDTQLGNTARWTVRGDDQALLFDRSVVFRGTAADGTITFKRTFTYLEGGQKWTVTETITGEESIPFRGVYAYKECEHVASGQCTSECFISADLELSHQP